MASVVHGTLTANVVKTVVVEAGWTGISVLNRDLYGELWVRFDGINPVIGGDNTYVVLGVREFSFKRRITGTISVQLLADQSRRYTIESI